MDEQQDPLDFLNTRRANSSLAQLAPLTAQVTNQIGAQTQKVNFSAATGPQPLPPVSNNVEAYVQQNQAKDATGNPIEFDYKNGIPMGIYMRTSLARDPESKLAILKGFYGDANVRTDSAGQPIVRTADQNGKPKDVLANPLGANFHDLTDFIGQAAIPAIATIAAARSGGKTPPVIADELGTVAQRLTGWLKQAASMAGIGEGAGAVQDVADRTAEGIPIRPGEIAASRAGMAALDVGIGGVGTIVGKAFGKAAAPFAGGQTQANVDAIAARDTLAREAASEGQTLNLVLTPAQETGSKTLQRFESFAKVHPGASGSFQDIERGNSQAFQTIENMLLDVNPEASLTERTAALPTGEQTGQALAGSVERNAIAPAESAIESASITAAQASERGLGGSIAASGSLPPIDTKQGVGEAIRSKLTNLRNAELQAASKPYEELMADPRLQKFSIPGNDLQTDLKSLVKELPQVEQTVTSESDLVDQFGKPSMVTERNVKVQKPYVPSGILSKFDQIMKVDQPSYRLNDLMKMRTEVQNAIAQGESVPGTDTHFLGGLKSKLTTAIHEGLNEIDPALRAKWESANEGYAKFAQKFHQAAISPVFTTPEQASFKGGESLVEHFTGGPRGAENFRRLKDVLGASSMEFQNLKGDVMRDMLASASSSIKGRLDAGVLIRNMDKFATDNPEVFKEVFGKNAGAMIDFARELGAVKGDLPAESVQQILQTPKRSFTALSNLVKAQSDASKLYNNSIVAKIRDGTLKPGSLNAEQLVSNLHSASLPQIQQIAGFLASDPAVLQMVQQKEMERLLFNAAIQKDVAGTAIGKVNYTQRSLLDALGSKDSRLKFEAIMGPDKIKTIETMAAFLGANGSDQTFGVAGGLSAGMQAGQLVRGNIEKYGLAYARSWLMAKILLSESLRKWVTNAPMSNAKANALLTGFLATTPVIRELISEVGDASAVQAMRQQKQAVNKRFPVQSQAGPSMNPNDAAEFLRQRRLQRQ